MGTAFLSLPTAGPSVTATITQGFALVTLTAQITNQSSDIATAGCYMGFSVTGASAITCGPCRWNNRKPARGWIASIGHASCGADSRPEYVHSELQSRECKLLGECPVRLFQPLDNRNPVLMICLHIWLAVLLLILALIGVGFIAFAVHVWREQH
jgi:hypothetical protein